jgi:iron complex transport system substrate-binding protein
MKARLFVIVFFLCMGSTAHAFDRIVSLKPNITEILFELGVGDRVVGVTTYCDYPNAAKRIPRVADYIKPFAEKLIVASPDLVIGSEENTSRKAIWQIQKMGYRVELFPFTTIDETLGSIEKIASLVGKEGDGKKLVSKIRKTMESVSNGNSSKQKPRVLVVWGQRPMVVTGPGTFMDELIDRVGAINVAGRGSMQYPHWNTENVIAADPEVIVDMSMGSEEVDRESWKDLSTVSAVKNGRIVTLDDSLFRAGPRLPEAVKALAKVVHGISYQE